MIVIYWCYLHQFPQTNCLTSKTIMLNYVQICQHAGSMKMITEHLGSTKKIQQAILSLPDAERVSILQWLIQMDRKLWDKEIQSDFSKGGPGASLLEQIKDDFRSGICSPWD